MSFLPSLNDKASLLDVFRFFPEASKPLIELHEVLLRGPSPFTEAERELIAAYVSDINRCHYCRSVHTATAERLGVPKATVRQAAANLETAPVDPKMKAILRYAYQLTQMPTSLTRSDAERVLTSGWDEQALLHAVAVTALFNFMNRLVEGLGIELDPTYVAPASQRLAERGYRPLINMLKL